MVHRCCWNSVYFMLQPHWHNTHTQTSLTTLCPGLPGWAGTRKVKPVWILLNQETVSGSGISWAICKSAPRSRQITTPAPHHSVLLQAGCPSCHPTNSIKALKANQSTEGHTGITPRCLLQSSAISVAISGNVKQETATGCKATDVIRLFSLSFNLANLLSLLVVWPGTGSESEPECDVTMVTNDIF